MRTPILLFATFLAACATLVPNPTPTQVETAQLRWPEASLESLSEGRKLYVRRCSSCHNLHTPGEYTVEEWPGILREMGKEYAKLEPPQEELVLRYIVSVLEMPPAEEPPRE